MDITARPCILKWIPSKWSFVRYHCPGKHFKQVETIFFGSMSKTKTSVLFGFCLIEEKHKSSSEQESAKGSLSPKGKKKSWKNSQEHYYLFSFIQLSYDAKLMFLLNLFIFLLESCWHETPCSVVDLTSKLKGGRRGYFMDM